MTTPPRQVEVRCPECGHRYQDWYSPSINLAIEEWTEADIEEATTATCPRCGFKVRFNSLVVSWDGVFEQADPE